MPLRIFDGTGNASTESVLKAIDYAIDNGANIINLSIGKSQFAYTDKLDSAIKRAYDNNVVVVVAAGNGDYLSSNETGVNLTNNPISPVCNNGGNHKYSIGVHAGMESGHRTPWTNYGDCAPFMAPGEKIVSTSIPRFNNDEYGKNYTSGNGTSFAAPMITGIIALGYNKY